MGLNERPVCVVRVWDKTLCAMQSRIAMVVGSDGDTTLVRLWMGRSFGRREVRWSHTARAIPVADVLRPATAREVTLGRRT
jgi:hypothetical protein